MMHASVRQPGPGGRPLAALCAIAVAVAGAVLALADAAPAQVRATASAAASGSTTSISTSQFVNQFDAEPYVGNGYFSQRIPAAGMGLLTGLGTIGWPLGTPRFTEALAAGLYATADASQIYPDETKQVIALIPTWSALTFATSSGDTYSPSTVTGAVERRLRRNDLLGLRHLDVPGDPRHASGHRPGGGRLPLQHTAGG